MSSTTHDLADKIAAFEVAHAALIEATENLDREVESVLDTLQTVPELQAFVDELPNSYPNARRVYEKIYRISSSSGN